MGKKRQRIALAVSKSGHYLDVGLGQVGPGVQGCSKLMAAYLGIHKMAVFQHMAFLFGNICGVAGSCSMPSDFVQGEYSVEMLKGRQSLMSRRQQDWNCGPRLTFRTGKISLFDPPTLQW